MKKILVIGDVHGKIGGYFDVLKDFVRRHRHSDHDLYTLQLGDFGFADTYQQKRKRIERSHLLGDDHYFIGGNHDDYDHYEDAHGSLGHFGEVPFIEDSFFIRGARSIDREARTAGHDWWEAEELDWNQSRNAVERYIEVEPKHVFSHDAPQSVPEHMFTGKENYPSNTGKLLEQMFQEHQPKTWTFGHWHKTVSKEINGTTFQCLGELETNEINESLWNY